MKWLIALSFLSILIFVPLFANADNVFCEYLTTTDCHACPEVSEMLYDIHNSNPHFYFVSMIADKSSDAMNRSEYYNVYGYPTAFFDGGYEVVFGKNDRSKYINSINECMGRDKKVNVNLNARWQANGVSIEATLKSNERYDGNFRIYVVEPVSRWNDDAGKPFHFGFIGYAYNGNITVDGSKKINAFWNSSYTDNIMFFGVVFSDSSEKRYSDPPANKHAFQAHFVDGMAAVKPLPDKPPAVWFVEKPSYVWGYDNVTFEWNGSDDNSIPLYSYRLAGEQWHEWGEKKKASYNLSDGKYTFYVRAKDNLGHITTISYSFIVDTSKPYVVSTIPSNNSLNVPVFEDIIIKFSHPMSRNVDISISPPADYSITWNGDYELHIKGKWKYTTRYTITIDAERPSGQRLHYLMTFTSSPPDTSRPVIISAEPFYGECYGTIKIKFSKPMDKNILHGVDISPWLPFKYFWKDNDTLLVLKLMEIKTGNYTVNINDELTDKYGNKLENFSFSFHITRPRIVFNNFEDVTMLSHDTLIIKFSHYMNISSVENSIKICPKKDNYSFEWKDNRTLEIAGTWSCGLNKITINGAEDIRGMGMQAKEMNFFVPCYDYGSLKEKSMPSFTLPVLIISVVAILLAMNRRKHAP